MKTYQVLVTAEATFEVEAESEEQAKEAAFDIIPQNQHVWHDIQLTIL